MNQFTNAIRNKVTDTWILWFLNRHEENQDNRLERAHRATQLRLAEHRQIKELAEPWQPGIHVYGHDGGLYTGPVIGVVTWSRDCDHACGETKSVIPATLKAYDAFRESQLEWADGPMTFRLERLSEPFRRWSRDMVLEAFEDGHAFHVRDAYTDRDDGF